MAITPPTDVVRAMEAEEAATARVKRFFDYFGLAALSDEAGSPVLMSSSNGTRKWPLARCPHGHEQGAYAALLSDGRIIAGCGTCEPITARDEESESLDLMTSKQFLDAMATEVPYLVADLLTEEGSSAFCSLPGEGKTTLLVNLALAVARGTPFLSRATRQVPVLYLGLEGALNIIGDTFRRCGLQAGDAILVRCVAMPQDVPAALRYWSRQHKLGLIIADTLGKLVRADDLNAYAEMVLRMQAVIKDVTYEFKNHVAVAHHSSKAGAAALGSVAIEGEFDTVFHIEQGALGLRKITTRKMRVGRLIEGSLIYDRETKRITLDATGAAMEKAEASLVEKIMTALRENGTRFAAVEALAKQIGQRKETVGKEIKLLRRMNLVERKTKLGVRLSTALLTLNSEAFEERIEDAEEQGRGPRLKDGNSKGKASGSLGPRGASTGPRKRKARPHARDKG